MTSFFYVLIYNIINPFGKLWNIKNTPKIKN